MKTRLTKSIVTPLIVLTALFVLGYRSAYAQSPAEDRLTSRSADWLADNTGKGARAIEGTWNASVTIRNCQTGTPLAAFKAMDIFIQGGSVIDTNAAPPNTRGPGFGDWAYAGEHTFTSTIRFFLYNADGSFAGVRRIAQNIEINDAADAWTSTVDIVVFDPAGNPVTTACATAAATRAP